MQVKIKHHIKKHRLALTISALLLVVVGVAVTLNYRTLLQSRQVFVTTTLERQSLSELNLYHESSTNLVQRYFESAIGTVTNLSTNQSIQKQLTARQSTPLNTELEQQRTISGQFDSFTLMAADGKVVGFVSDKGGGFIGSDGSKIAAFVAAKDAPGTVLVGASQSPLKRVIFSIASPIRDKDGKLLGVTIGALTMPTLASHIQLSSQYNKDLSSLLTDSTGNILVQENKSMDTLVNLIGKEPVIDALAHQQTVPANEEYNFNQQKSLAQGSALSFGTAGSLYVASFYNTAGYKPHLDDAMQDVNTVLSTFILRNVILLTVTFIIIAIIIRIYENRRA